MAPVLDRQHVFEFPGDIHFENAFRVDAESVKSRPIRDNLEFYSQSGKSESSLIISDISEGDVELILSMFPSIKHLTLEKVQILNKDIKGLPVNIVTLKLIKCRIEKPVVKSWFKGMGKELTSVSIIASYFAVPLGSKGAIAGQLKHLPGPLRNLRIEDPIRQFYSGGLPNAEHIHLDFLDDRDNMALRWSPKELHTLTLRLCLHRDTQEHFEDFARFEKINNLRILTPVPKDFVQKLQSLPNLKTLDVFCYEPSEEPNQILRLNDDCLAHIFNFLETDDCIALIQTHPRFDHVVGTYVLPRQEVEWYEGYLEKLPNNETRKSILDRIGENAKSLFISGEDWLRISSHFKSLESLYLNDEWDSDVRRLIPASIKKLEVDCDSSSDWYDDEYDEFDSEDYDSDEYFKPKKRQPEFSTSALFKKLDQQLVTLIVHKSFHPEDLAELHNIREFACRDFKAKDLRKFLRQNQKQMESLKIHFFNEHRRSPKWYAWWDDFEGPEYEPPPSFRLCPMEVLKVLHLEGINCKIDLKPADFPSLEEIKVDFDYELKPEIESHITGSISKFDHLKSLKVGNCKERDLKWVYGMKNLVSLDLLLKDEQLLGLMKALPNLAKYTASDDYWSLEFLEQIREFLIAANRTLEVHKKYSDGGLILLP